MAIPFSLMLKYHCTVTALSPISCIFFHHRVNGAHTKKKAKATYAKVFFLRPSSALAEERLRNFAAHKTKRKGTKESFVRGFFENSLLESALDTILQINNKRRSWRQSAKCEREGEEKRKKKYELFVCVRQDIDSLCVIGYFMGDAWVSQKWL